MQPPGDCQNQSIAFVILFLWEGEKCLKHPCSTLLLVPSLVSLGLTLTSDAKREGINLDRACSKSELDTALKYQKTCFRKLYWKYEWLLNLWFFFNFQLGWFCGMCCLFSWASFYSWRICVHSLAVNWDRTWYLFLLASGLLFFGIPPLFKDL